MTSAEVAGHVAGEREAANSTEFCLLGIDRCPKSSSPGQDGEKSELETTVGLVSRLTWDMKVSLDGDGGFSLRRSGRGTLHFKPASVQALWTVIQTLHMIVGQLRPQPDAQQQAAKEAKRLSERSSLSTTKGASGWELDYPITSSQSCVNDWNRMADLLVTR